MLGNRIQRARKAKGLSLRELGSEINLSHAAIKKYEDDVVIPSSDILIKLAKALNVKVEYFFRRESFSLKNIEYRKHEDLSKKSIDAVTAIILEIIERRIELENLFPVSPIKRLDLDNLPDQIIHESDAEQLADQIRSQWNLGNDPVPDLIDLFEEKGIKVFIIDDANPSYIDGMYAVVNTMPIMVISSQFPGDRQRFTLAHELGHLILDKIKDVHIDAEKFCNRFAGAFLLPRQSVLNIMSEHRNSIEPKELSLIKNEYGISMTAILHRLQDSNIITDALYREMRGEFSKNGWDKTEPGKPYPKVSTHIFQQMIFHALAEDYISESKAAELMNLSLTAFRSLRAMECGDDVSYQ